MDNDNNFLKISLILENVKFNIKIINNLKEHFKILLSTNVIFSDKYDDMMDKLKFLHTESTTQLNSLSIIEYLFNGINKKIVEIDIKNTINKINILKSNIVVVSNELNNIVEENGYTTICELLKILNKSQYEKYEQNLIHKIDILENFFQPIKIKRTETQYKENINIKIKTIPIEPNIKNVSDKYVNFETNEHLKINLIYELNKAIIEIEIENSLYVIDGYFKEDTFNELYFLDVYEYKYKNIKKKINTSTIIDKNKLIIFYKQYMNQMSIKDFIILEEDDIIDKVKKMYELLNTISRLSVLEILEKIAKKDIYAKRDIIILLLMDNDDNNIELENDKLNSVDDLDDINNDIEINMNDDRNIFKIENIKNDETNALIKIDINNKPDIKSNQLIIKSPISKVKLNKATATRYSINSIMKNFDKTNEMRNLNSILTNSKKILNANVLMDFLRNNELKSIEYDNFKNSIHWSLRKKIFAKSLIDTKPNNTEEISWETKLSLMDLSDKIKDKINEKIKEANSSKENTKAITYIESFFKIPFGKFIREDIFIESEKSNKKIKNIITKINNHIDNENDYIHLSDSLEQLKQKILNYRLLHNIDNIYYDLINEKNKIITLKQNYMNKVEKILDEAVYGHNESKREIKRLIAQWMGGKMDGAILGFHGPPGVGKTCFAKKGIAKCLFDTNGESRPFCIFQLGGATDGSVLEGHSYTYVGAKQGRLIEFLQETKCMNPIIYFDELDKVSETEKGKEILDILIHLTDKSQNNSLFDKYFSGIELDFSKCIIIFSYNDVNKVNRILRDRITEIKINPLKKNEKIHIIKKYTFKEINDELNFNCNMDDDLIEYIIDTYTFESGVRKLNEKFYQIFREINLRILENPYLDFKIDKNLIDEILNRHYKVRYYQIHTEPKVGLINGLYASTVGLGGITLIQIKKIITTQTNMPLELTGQQGDIMKESMSCAKTLAMNLLNIEEKNLILNDLKMNPFGLHIHCPDGATPKDGPSAGITITTGIYSVLTGKKIRNDIAMTGEVDLLGNVKAIGGLDAKINGAIKAGVKLVIFPKENEQDWDKIVKDKLLDGVIDFYMAETIEQVIAKSIVL